MRTISFITANYVARALNYSAGPDWAAHDRTTVAKVSAETFGAIAKDIASAGFEAIDIWMAHCHWKHHDREDYLEVVKGICSQYDFTITSYAGGLDASAVDNLEAPFRFMKQLGAPILAGGIFGADAQALTPRINDICQKLGVQYAFENHPEKTPAEILAKIHNGSLPNVGVALDTGWCGTHGMDALECAKAMRDKLLVVHLKDIRQAGAHETCTLGDGIVGIEKVVRFLVDTDWSGDLCIEHEPYDRDPMPEVKESLRRLRQWLQ